MAALNMDICFIKTVLLLCNHGYFLKIVCRMVIVTPPPLSQHTISANIDLDQQFWLIEFIVDCTSIRENTFRGGGGGGVNLQDEKLLLVFVCIRFIRQLNAMLTAPYLLIICTKDCFSLLK